MNRLFDVFEFDADPLLSSGRIDLAIPVTVWAKSSDVRSCIHTFRDDRFHNVTCAKTVNRAQWSILLGIAKLVGLASLSSALTCRFNSKNLAGQYFERFSYSHTRGI